MSTRRWIPLSLCLLFACTAVGEVGDEPEEEVAPPRPGAAPPLTPAGAPEIPVDEGARCGDVAAAKEAAPVDPKAAVTEGRMLIRQGDAWLGLPLRETRYDTVVVGLMAETSVVQVFQNPTKDRLEALYNFPLPPEAAVDDYAIRVGGREIRGLMKSREEARKTYEAAREAGQSAALLEQQRPNLFTQSVANIPPDGTIEVEIHFVQPLRRIEGRYGLTLPMVVGPRYIPGSDAKGEPRVPDAAAIAAPVLPEGVASCSPVDVQVTIESPLALTGVRSKYHALDLASAAGRTQLTLARGAARANRDFDVSWELAGAEPRAQLMAQRTGAEGGYFTLTIEPPRAFAREKARPRELVFALDTSGSMSGAPMDTAVSAVKRALEGMGEADTFQILRFAGDTSQLADAPLPNTPENRKRGVDFLTSMESGGGTEMLAGIKASLDRQADPSRLRMVLFLTDGYIGNEAEIFADIEQRRGDARLFGLGVGSSVNHYLLDGMSRLGRGAVTYVGPGEQVDAVVERFYGYVGRPVLTDIELDWGDLPAFDVLPGALPDLFAGQPVVVYGRFKGDPGAGQVTLRAKLGDAPFEQRVRVDFGAQQHDGLRSMWARQQIDAMMGYPNQQSPDDAAKEKITAFAIEHRIMTSYTSFVAVETEKQQDGELKTVVVPVERPLGVSDKAGMLAQVPGSFLASPYGGTYSIGGDDADVWGGLGSGYGRGSGAGFGGRGTRVPQVRQAKAQVQGSMDKEVIRRVIRSHINEVRHCYNQALAKDPNAKGRIAVQFMIGPTGHVRSAIVQESTMKDAAVGTCVSAAVKRWIFPKPTGSSVLVTYPFILEI